ncbi:MAG: UDP-N-acetylmuramoyl-tripeptide--D-alanyl-D-alanine ligase [Clostridia bacterium]|nr:UDP-N-acetylmuramoyl-tripeptide--D-alanyl-D-alanine ligase [Clostridia bacterium]
MRTELCRLLRNPDVLGVALRAEVRFCGRAPMCIKGIATDSREVCAGDLFVALKGEHTDGVLHIGEALRRGAGGLLVPTGTPLPAGDLVAYFVPSVEQALLAAAAYRRGALGGRVIAVGGSVGKTTVKEAVTRVLAACGEVRCNEGNYNSSVGMPLSLLSMEDAPHLVLELGINHPGEMAALSRALAPDLALLLNVGCAHIGNFQSRDELIHEKLQIAAGLRTGGALLLPDTLCGAETGARILRVGKGQEADFRAENISVAKKGTVLDIRCGDRVITKLAWPIPGESGVNTLAFVASVGMLAGCSDDAIRQGLRVAGQYTPRMRRVRAGTRLLLDDTYNAAPESVLAALETLVHTANGRPAVAVLGDMLELGKFSDALHGTVGEAAANSGICALFTCGTRAEDIAKAARRAGLSQVQSFAEEDIEALAEAICRTTPPDAVILFKAAHRMMLGRAVAAVRRLV